MEIISQFSNLIGNYLADYTEVRSEPKKASEREAKIVADTKRIFGELTYWRNNFASQWQECAELILPTFRNTFFYGNYNMPGEKKTFRQVDATGMLALSRFAAILDSLL